MTTPGGAQYLPPVVTRLLGDASDLLEKFAAAKAAQEAYAAGSTDMADRVHSSTRVAGRDMSEFADLVTREMRAGETATATLKRRMSELGDEMATLRKKVAGTGDASLYRDFRRAGDELERMRHLAREIAPELLAGARTIGQRFGVEVAGAFSGLSGMLIPAIIAAIVVASPVIASLLGAAIGLGVTLGFAGLGIVLAAFFNSKVKRLFMEIGREFKRVVGKAVTGSFDDALVRALQLFKTFIPVIGEQLRRIFDSLAPALEPLSQALGLGIKAFLDDIMGMIPAFMPALLAFIDTIPAVMNAVAEFLETITADGPALARFIQDAANAIVVFLGGAANVIVWLEETYEWLVKLNDAFPILGWQRQLIGLGIAVTAVKNFFIDLWHTIVDAAKGVGSWFADLGRSIWDGLRTAGQAVADWFNNTVKWFQELPGRVIGFLASMPGRVQAVVSQMAHQAAYWVGWLVGTWVRYLREAPPKMLALIIAAWLAVQAKTREGVAATVAFVQALPGRIATFFSQLWTNVTGWAARTWSSVTAWFARTRQSMIEHIVSGINSVIAWFRGLPGRAATEGRNFKDRLIGFFKGAKTWLYDAGKAIVRGIIDGVSSLWGWAVDKVRSFAHDILKGFKGALGISSPAKAFEGPGAMSALGYVRGWSRTMRRVRKAFDGPSTADVVLGGDVEGRPRPPGGYGAPSSGGEPMLVHATFTVDGRAIVEATTPASQKRGARNGITGTGIPTTRIM